MKKIILLLVMILLIANVGILPASASPTDSPYVVMGIRRPGLERVWMQTAEGSTLAHQWDGGENFALSFISQDARHFRVSESSMFGRIERYEITIIGDALEFYGEAIHQYLTGYRSAPVHEVFSDGERLTFFVDYTHRSSDELFVPYRRVAGNRPSMISLRIIYWDGSVFEEVVNQNWEIVERTRDGVDQWIHPLPRISLSNRSGITPSRAVQEVGSVMTAPSVARPANLQRPPQVLPRPFQFDLQHTWDDNLPIWLRIVEEDWFIPGYTPQQPPRNRWPENAFEGNHGTIFVNDAKGVGASWWVGGRSLPPIGEGVANPHLVQHGTFAGLVNANFDFAARGVITCVRELADIDRMEVVIRGDALEFYGTSVLIYSNGHRTYPIHEIFADGERLTFFIDHSQNATVEMYAQFRSVAGTVDTTIWRGAIRNDGRTTGIGVGTVSHTFRAEASVNSQYVRTRPIGTGNAEEFLILNTDSRPRPIYVNDVLIMSTAHYGSPIGSIPIPRPDRVPTSRQAPILDPLSVARAAAIVPAPVRPPLPAANQVATANVIINGQRLSFDVPPQSIGGRTMLPLRALFEEMGAEVEWDAATQTATATRGSCTVVLSIGSLSPTVNGVAVNIDQPGVIVDGRTLAPLRFVAEAFGGTVNWDHNSSTATITMD